MEKTSKILVTGASGLIGSALVRLLKADGYSNLLTPSSLSLNSCKQENVVEYFNINKPEYIFHLSAYVGGIKTNIEYPTQLIHYNTVMQIYIMSACKLFKVKKLLFPGSACAYPRDAEQPIKESSFLQGMPEPTNLAYAVAKINGIVMAQSYAKQYGMNVVLPMVANTYGIGDRSSHVIPDLIRKLREEKDGITLWGTGSCLREFIYADDVASAFLFLMRNYNSSEIINVGSGEEISILNLAHMIAKLSGYSGKISTNSEKPDGASRKCLDSSRLYAMGWKPEVGLEDGLRMVCAN